MFQQGRNNIFNHASRLDKIISDHDSIKCLEADQRSQIYITCVAAAIYAGVYGEHLVESLDKTSCTVDDIFNFIMAIYSSAQYSTACNIISLIYIRRATKNGGMELTPNNWRSCWLSAIAVAMEFWDGRHLETSVLVSQKIISRHVLYPVGYELIFLEMLQYCLEVTPELYSRYVFAFDMLYKTSNVHRKNTSGSASFRGRQISREFEDELKLLAA